MKRTLSLLLIGIMLLAGAAPTLAQGVPEPQPRPWRDWGVIIRSHHVDVSIVDQVATTRVEQVFFNEGNAPAEGTYIFPLPVGAAVSDLVMWVDGKPIEARILDAGEARAIYDEIVRRMRDPALLEYVGAGAIQASVFPIQPRSEVKIEFEYAQLLPAENGLIHYQYPLRTDQFTRQPVERLSLSLSVTSREPIGAVYSPTHDLAILRDGDFAFRAGFETSGARPATDFSLYYGLATSEISANLLAYRESADEDGTFALMITPPAEASAERVIPKDVIVVLDQSGSMEGAKWDQARDAVKFVLEHLNAQDRFNVIAFSTGTRIYARGLQPVSEAPGAKAWIGGLEALGSTDIDLALREAMGMADRERPTVVLFLTDGLPTEGVTDTPSILANVKAAAPGNVRVFTFGVGYDVDTLLLDQLYQEFRGAGTYVRPEERIDDEVSALYAKISAPVLTDLELDFGAVMVDDLFPSAPLPDLFAGTQLIVVGRFRDGGDTTITLRGTLEGQQQVYRYDVRFPPNAGGAVFVPRLWATRKIGALLSAIRLHGEDPELVDSIVRLSIRYGIITPYTSFLITEDDIFTQRGVEEAQMMFEADAEMLAAPSGQAAVDAAESAAGLSSANAPVAAPTRSSKDAGGVELPAEAGEQAIRYAGDRTFVWRDGMWIDTLYEADAMTPVEVTFLSDEYFDLLALDPAIGEFLALGEQVLFVWAGTAYQIVTGE
ncbi:MAG TPA: VIT domain-containing protein [Aggregatilineaceae bacterium]|nr:VIT domain-containing protein [Aggregatilineaceae bacterium]